ncbi:MAG: hypothetical protein ETSY2_06185 [Candidatus Entotheonella gemina]|uniref:Uncharacterized protein n=1 Tax=Candidatus Entotheonella gemina TaxID=1429439 RepID=W4MDR4_9BACT|nr:MAG: hypothetical protein ETSY2_06185 [Candidatus Entotheonella gemina]
MYTKEERLVFLRSTRAQFSKSIFRLMVFFLPLLAKMELSDFGMVMIGHRYRFWASPRVLGVIEEALRFIRTLIFWPHSGKVVISSAYGSWILLLSSIAATKVL